MRRDVTYRGDERRLLSVSHDGKNLINFIARSTGYNQYDPDTPNGRIKDSFWVSHPIEISI